MAILFQVNCSVAPSPSSTPSSSSNSLHILWPQVSSTDIEQLDDQHLPLLSSDIVKTGCSSCNEYLEKYAQQLVSALLDCALCCFPCRFSSSSGHLAGWNDKCRKQKDDANFWSKVWEEAGCLCSGAHFNSEIYQAQV